MKKVLLIFFASIIIFSACENESTETQSNDYINLSISELARELALDPVFSNHKEQSLKEIYRISRFYIEKINKSSFKELAKNEILDQIKVNDDYWAQREMILVQNREYINNKFALDERPIEEVISLFKILYQTSSITSTSNKIYVSPYISNDCHTQFENDIADAHATYDSAIYVGCTAAAAGAVITGVAGPITAGGVYAACAVGAVAVAVYEVSVAIDEFNACIQN
jgi:hypothetical protein